MCTKLSKMTHIIYTNAIVLHILYTNTAVLYAAHSPQVNK